MRIRRRLAQKLVFAAMLVMPFASTASGQETEEDVGLPVPTAAVMLDGRELFRLRGVSAYPAEKRAGLIVERIVSLARDPAFKVENLRIVESETFSEIRGGDFMILRIFDADARLEQGLERKLLASVYLETIRTAIEQHRSERSRDPLLRKGLYALLATLVSAALFLLVLRIERRLDSLIERRFKQRFPSVGIKSFEILRAEQIRGFVRGLITGLRTAILLLLAYFYLTSVLGLFPWTRAFARRLLPYVIDPIATIGQNVLDYLPKFVFLILLLLIVRFVLRILRLFFLSVERRAVSLSGFSSEWAQPTYRLVRLAVVAFAVVLAYPYIPGSDSGAFKGISIFVGVIFSLGGTSFISNIIAGYSMQYRRAFKVGDRVRINDVTGDVVEMRLLVTHLRSLKNEEIVIPNSVILGTQVINFSSLATTQGLILHTTVGIGYEVPWRQVEAMLHAAADRTPGVLKEPAPFVLQTALADFSVIYELNAFCNEALKTLEIYSDLHRNILDVFNEYGVQIMTPFYTGDPDQPKMVPKEQWTAAPAKPG